MNRNSSIVIADLAFFKFKMMEFAARKVDMVFLRGAVFRDTYVLDNQEERIIAGDMNNFTESVESSCFEFYCRNDSVVQIVKGYNCL